MAPLRPLTASLLPCPLTLRTPLLLPLTPFHCPLTRFTAPLPLPPLQCACITGHRDCVTLALDYGADILAQYDGRTLTPTPTPAPNPNPNRDLNPGPKAQPQPSSQP